MTDITLPAEWEPQSGIQLTWPHADTDWNYMLDEVTACYISIAQAISQQERLLIVCKNAAEVTQQLSGANSRNITLCEISTNDTWARDHGGISIRQADGKLEVCDFCFNGWGLKFAANLDNQITRRMYGHHLFAPNVAYRNCLNFVLEGGSIESDGQGTILTTVECLLSANRNEQFSQDEIETRLHQFFGTKRVLWLHHGALQGDDTDSHVDTLARFCDANTIAYVQCRDTNDPHYGELKAMEDELKTFRTASGQPYRLLALPMADKVVIDEERLPATYANFLIMNNAVLVPTYGTSHDEDALNILSQAFPERKIIGINCVPLIRQHGSLHCITMQYPAGVIK